MTSKIIELKQNNNLTNVIDKRGEYIVNISNDILLEDGDQILMKNCFLDTSASSSEQISIDQETDVKITFNRYIMDNIPEPTPIEARYYQMLTNINYVNPSPPNFNPSNPMLYLNSPLGCPLFETECFTRNDPNQLVCIRITAIFSAYINMDRTRKRPDGIYNFMGGKPLTVQYIDWEIPAVKKVFHPKFPSIEVQIKNGVPVFTPEFNGEIDLKIDIPCINGSILNISTDDTNESNFMQYGTPLVDKMDAQYTEDPSTAPYYRKLVEKTLIITIEPGVYSPLEIANLISTGAQTGSSGEFISESGEMSDNICLDYNKTYVNETDNTKNTFAFASSGININLETNEFIPKIMLQNNKSTSNKDGGIWSGASQVALEFDDEQNKFFFSYIHTPAYSAPAVGNTAGDFAVKITKEPAQATASWNGSKAGGDIIAPYTRYEKKGGGILLFSLEPADFWHDKLGFDMGAICANKSYLDMDGLNGKNGTILNQGAIYDLSKMNAIPNSNMVVEGVTGTSPRIVSSMNIKKNNDYQTAQPPTTAIPLDTVEIYASNQVLEDKITNGYYYIDVLSNFQNSITDNNETFKNTVGIVSNYFNSNSFTTGTSSDSLIYTHRGTSQRLSNFHVRILDEDRNHSDDLGENNVVFLEIVQQNAVRNAIKNLTIEEEAQATLKNQQKQEK